MRESLLHKLIFARSSDLGPRVLIGPGDDCASVATPAGCTLVTVDQVIEGRHFVGPLGTGTPVDLAARKSMARSVSDLAAMGGTPAWALATGALPPGMEQGLADALFERLAHWARRWSCPLVGGDIATLPEGAPLVLTVTVGGDPHPRRGPVLRSGAQAGDQVLVTGRIGGSLASGRHLAFEPRVVEGAWLAETLGDQLHAMIDLSDGLGRDAARIGAASGVRLEIEAAAVPRHDDAGPTALSDGEDYELLFTVAPGSAVPDRCPATGTPVTRIGRVVAAPAGRAGGAGGCVLIDQHGRATDAGELGWDH